MAETLEGAKELQKQQPKKPFINAAFDAIEERRLKGFERAAFEKMGMPYPSADSDRSVGQKGR